jgi:peptide/nickel transport system permease protein
MVGLSLPGVLTAGVVIEFVFNIQGIGLSFYTAATTSDYPVELGITILVGLVTVLGNLFADVMYAVLDPRVRYD